MGISGMWGAYAAESSEVAKKISELERHLMSKVTKSELARDTKKTVFLIAFVDGISPMIISFLMLTPFFFSSFGLITINTAYLVSVMLTAVVLFILGMFTGHTAKENLLKSGIRMVAAGVVVGILFFILAKTGLL